MLGLLRVARQDLSMAADAFGKAVQAVQGRLPEPLLHLGCALLQGKRAGLAERCFEEAGRVAASALCRASAWSGLARSLSSQGTASGPSVPFAGLTLLLVSPFCMGRPCAQPFVPRYCFRCFCTACLCKLLLAGPLPVPSDAEVSILLPPHLRLLQGFCFGRCCPQLLIHTQRPTCVAAVLPSCPAFLPCICGSSKPCFVFVCVSGGGLGNQGPRGGGGGSFLRPIFLLPCFLPFPPRVPACPPSFPSQASVLPPSLACYCADALFFIFLFFFPN